MKLGISYIATGYVMDYTGAHAYKYSACYTFMLNTLKDTQEDMHVQYDVQDIK